MQKLELTWIGKGQEPAVEPRILLHDASRDYGDPNVTNMLIHGDNLLALKALEQEFAGRVKCVYIDPPFNTQQAFDHYQDGIEHSIWLNLMYARLKLLRSLLSNDGTLFVHIDDNEFCYLIAVLDEIMGRQNRISIVTFKQASATGHKAINPGVVSVTNFILIYAKNKSCWTPQKLYTDRGERDKRYSQFIENYDEPFEHWSFITLSKAFAQSLGMAEKDVKKELGDDYEQRLTSFVHENAGKVMQLATPDYNAVSSAARELIDTSRKNTTTIFKLGRKGYSDMYFYKGKRILFYADKLKLVAGKYVDGEPLTSLWDDILSNNIHNEGGVEFPKGKKPEALIKRCLELSTKASYARNPK
jgi:adenine-specific DNA-methyltransferase